MKVYTNQATGLKTVIGPIVSISEDGSTMVVSSETRDKEGVHPVKFTVKSAYPLTDDEYKPGMKVTCVGYQAGKDTINAEAVLIKNNSYTVEDLSFVTGLVKRARMNEEKNEDGSPKVNKEGKPKKPHFDVTVVTKEADGGYCNHRIKIYDSNKTEAGKRTNIEIAKAMFGKFDPENNRIAVSVITSPGNEYVIPSTGADGKEYQNRYCDHMGYRAIDIEYIDEKKKDKTAPTNAPQKAPQQSTPTPAPAQTQDNGFENSGIDMDDMDMFS